MSVCFVASHPAAADHFPPLAASLEKKGITCLLFARGEALKKLQERKLEAIPFNELKEIYDKCATAGTVITELCDPEMQDLHNVMMVKNPLAARYAYYDNAQSFVSLHYGESAEKTILAAGRVIFANGNLKTFEKSPGEFFDTSGIEVCSLGFNPSGVINTFIALREKYSKEPKEQQTIVFFGAATEEYKKAFPQLLLMLDAAQKKMPNHRFLLQPHPRCDIEMQTVLPENITISPYLFNDAVGICDTAVYFQTGDAPKIALAGAPIIHLAPVVNQNDLLVKNRACPTATSVEELVICLETAQPLNQEQQTATRNALGERELWEETLYYTVRPIIRS